MEINLTPRELQLLVWGMGNGFQAFEEEDKPEARKLLQKLADLQGDIDASEGTDQAG